MAPRSCEPISLDEFAEVIASGVAWRDNPAAASNSKRGVNKTDICLNIDDVTCDGPPLTSKEMKDSNDQGEVLGERCTGLVAIDKIVYRPTREPAIRLVLRHPRRSKPFSPQEPAKVLFTWECEGLYGWTDPDPYQSQFVKNITPRRDRTTERTLPLELEPAMRTAAAALGVNDDGPIAIGTKPGTDLEAPSDLGIKVLMEQFSTVAANILGDEKSDLERATKASEKFAEALEAGDYAQASGMASAMRRAAIALVKTPRKLEDLPALGPAFYADAKKRERWRRWPPN